VQYQVTVPPYRRAVFPAAALLLWALILDIIFSDPDGTRPANLTLMGILLAWVTVYGARGWRAATLTVTDARVTFRGLAWTRSWRWELIDGFAAETRPMQWVRLPGRVRRRVLGIRLRDGHTAWLHELNGRPGRDGHCWVDAAADRLNELAQQHASATG
jgi:hypothetical protein